jgi:drug/metabolite transporter (DMT)-like permease
MSVRSSRSQLAAVAGLLCATFAWGASFILVKMTIAEMNLYSYIFLRFCVATALMVLLFPRRSSPPTARRSAPPSS